MKKILQDKTLEEIKKRKIRELMDKIKAKEKIMQYPSSPVTISDSNFESFVRRYPLVAIDFWATWCGPCRMSAPIIESLAKSYAGRVAFGKLNVDENQRLSWEYKITSIPSLVIIKNTVEVDRIIGAVPKNIIEATIQKYL